MAVDPYMEYALQLGHGLGEGRVLTLPPTLGDSERLGQFIEGVDGLLMGDDPATAMVALGRRLRALSDASASVMPNLADPLDRLAVVLRLWAGCVMAAKTIADETLSGPNTREDRTRLFRDAIDPLAAQDALFRAGVEAAPAFKRARGDSFFLDGVPEASPVRRWAAAPPGSA